MQTEEQKVGRPGNKTIVYIQDVAGKRKVDVGSLGVQGFIQACKLAGGDESLGW